MEKWQEKVKEIKEEFTTRITQDSSAEEIEKINQSTAKVDELDKMYLEVEQENRKLKDAIARMVTSQGSSDKPNDPSDPNETKPLTLDEIIAEKLKQKEK